MKRYSLRHFIRYALWALVLLFPFCASFNTSLATGIGSVVSLDGDGDEVRVQHSQSLVLTDALTIEAWIHPSGPGADGINIIINKEGEYELGRHDDGSIRFAVSNADPGWNWINTGFIAPEGTWTHLAFTYSSSQNRFQLFADGRRVYSSTGTGEIGDADETHNFFKIGARREGSGQFFHGEIDEVRVWNIVRSETEIRARMNTSLQGNESGLVGYWNFDNGTTNDLSNHGNHGVLRGNAAIVPSTATGQVAISAVPSTNSPAVGDTIEVAINIAGASNVAGYEFTLTFNSTQLQYISIENADYLPAGAFALEPTVASGSVQFNAIALSGTGEGDGTLAVVTFKVLTAASTTIGLENVEIADPTPQLIEVASVTGATINPTTSTVTSTTQTQVQVQPPTVPSTTTPTTGASTPTGQIAISAMPSVNNPTVGDTIEVSINISGGSNVGGYEFKLTFNPTQLQYISIENADYLPAGAFVPEPTVGSDSVRFYAAALGGTGEGDGTLAIATLKVLTTMRTTIGLEEVTIGDPAARPLPIASVTGATISPTTSSTPTTPTTETQVVTPTVPSTTTPTTDDRPVVPIVEAQIQISAVPSIDNPAVNEVIEIAINIAGGSDVAGYEFTLTFSPTQLQYISIENADYLPPGTFVPDANVEDGSVSFYAAAVRGTGEGDGTLAVATFRVLVDTETTIRFEDIVIGDQVAQPLGIASVTGATINRAAPRADTEVEHLLSIPAGINLVHVPLRVTAVDGMPKTIVSIADLYDALGGGSTVNFLITYDPQTQEWLSYFGAFDRGTSADKMLTDDTGVLAGMKARVSVRLRGSALGTDGNGIITLNPGPNVVGLPLRDSRVMRVSDLFALNGIGGNVPIITRTNNGEFNTVGRVGDPGDIQITGGQAFILTAQRPATVITYGEGWTNSR